MLVNHTYRFLFVHIPKTSGAAFREYHKKHLTNWWSHDYQEVGHAHDGLTPEIAEQYHDYYKFTIVRNPWTMIASAYRFDTQGVRSNKHGALIERSISIDDWLVEKANDPRFGPFPNQFRYISSNEKLLIDGFCRQETLSEDMAVTLDKLDAPYQDEDWEKPCAHYHGSYEWESYFKKPETRKLVRTLCHEDFAYFGWPSPFECAV